MLEIPPSPTNQKPELAYFCISCKANKNLQNPKLRNCALGFKVLDRSFPLAGEFGLFRELMSVAKKNERTE